VPDYKHDLPTNYYFGGGDEATSATPMAVVVLLVAVGLMFVLPRKYAFVPFLIAVMLVPLHVVLILGGLHFNATRMLIIAGWLRVICRREYFPSQLGILDKLVFASALCNAIMYSVLWGDIGAVVNRLGILLTTLGGYFLVRALVRNQEDIIRVIMALAVAAALIAPSMLYEHSHAYNPFWLLGAPEITNVRDGQIRAQGPFGHAITAGVVGAVLLPLFVGLIFEGRRVRLLAVGGVTASMAMIFASHSSTPVLTLAAAILGLAMWTARRNMRAVRWGVVLGLLVVQVGMTSPVWFIMDRASGVMGGSGWHRAMLVDNFVRHFWEWWLYGTRANPDWGWSMWDVDNAYVGAGLSGGLLSFILFIAILVYGFKIIGKGRRIAENRRREARLIWLLGVALFANAVAFFGIVYFDQAIVAWYALLAMIATVPAFAAQESSATVKLTTALTPIELHASPAHPVLRWHDHELGNL